MDLDLCTLAWTVERVGSDGRPSNWNPSEPNSPKSWSQVFTAVFKPHQAHVHALMCTVPPSTATVCDDSTSLDGIAPRTGEVEFMQHAELSKQGACTLLYIVTTLV